MGETTCILLPAPNRELIGTGIFRTIVQILKVLSL